MSIITIYKQLSSTSLLIVADLHMKNACLIEVTFRQRREFKTYTHKSCILVKLENI